MRVYVDSPTVKSNVAALKDKYKQDQMLWIVDTYTADINEAGDSSPAYHDDDNYDAVTIASREIAVVIAESVDLELFNIGNIDLDGERCFVELTMKDE